jgi:hydrophobic/amphiphilic exporter-1 (mainly G- bacteria), HAE1 family
MARSKEKLNGNIIADTSINQPVFITMVMLLAVVVGWLGYSTLPVNLLPDIEIPTVAVQIAYPGAGPESMADQVAKPIEDQLITISGIRHITSQSNEGSALFITEFDDSVPVDLALQEVRDKVNAILPALPQDVTDPVFLKFDPNQQAILTMALSSKSGQSPLALRELVDNEIAPRLQQAEGVGAVTVTGGQVRQINVLMDLEKLKAYRILPAQITSSISNANANLGLGDINAGEQEINLRAPSQIQTPQDIGDVQITNTPAWTVWTRSASTSSGNRAPTSWRWRKRSSTAWKNCSMNIPISTTTCRRTSPSPWKNRWTLPSRNCWWRRSRRCWWCCCSSETSATRW